jgi:hypothetical protein
VVHPQLSHSGFLMDGALVRTWLCIGGIFSVWLFQVLMICIALHALMMTEITILIAGSHAL